LELGDLLKLLDDENESINLFTFTWRKRAFPLSFLDHRSVVIRTLQGFEKMN